MRRKILFLTIADRMGASSRYRVFNYLPMLEAEGFQSEVIVPALKGKGVHRILGRRDEESHLLQRAKEADLIFIQKRLFTAGFIDRLRRTRIPIVFDFDDAIYTSPKGDWSAITRSKVRRRLAKVLSGSDAVIAGNRHLSDFACKYNERVEVLPSAIDLTHYRLKEQPGEGNLVLGWMGSKVNHPYLASLESMFRELSKENLPLTLRVVSDLDFELTAIPVENRRWSEETELEDLLSFDIGLMPLADDEWTQGKCALKALQYMAAGLPAVCSAVGANHDVIEHGRDGFLCRRDSDWTQALVQLAKDKDLRRDMGRRARRTVEKSFSTREIGHRLVELLRSCLSDSISR